MSIVRNAAVQIANIVVRYASTGSKEWAQAISNELMSIESDWQSLAWALGALRVLFTIQPSPLNTIADLDGEAQKYADRRRHAMNNGWLGTNARLFTPLLWSLLAILQIATGHAVLGNALQLLGWLLVVPMTYLRTREPDVPDRDDQANLVRFYVNELSASSRNSLPFWMVVAGTLFLICGFELTVRGGWLAMMPFILLPILAWFIAMHISNRRRLAQIKELLSGNSTA